MGCGRLFSGAGPAEGPQPAALLPVRLRVWLRPAQYRDRAWLAYAREVVAGSDLRADARRHTVHLAELIAGRADWSTLRSRPTMALLVQLSGLSLRTVQRRTRWLEAAGLLQVAESGTTPRFDPSRLRPGDANQAREWVLVMHSPELAEMSSPLSPTADLPSTGMRELLPIDAKGQDGEDRRYAPGSLLLAPPQWLSGQPIWPSSQNPQRRGERLTAAATLARHCLPLRRLSARHIRSITRLWWRSGWTVSDVLYAIETTPDGSPHRYTERVIDPARWLGHRLSYWLGQDGQPVPPHSTRQAEQHARRLAEQVAQRGQLLDPAGTAQARDRAARQAAGQAPTLRQLFAARHQAARDALYAALPSQPSPRKEPA